MGKGAYGEVCNYIFIIIILSLITYIINNIFYYKNRLFNILIVLNILFNKGAATNKLTNVKVAIKKVENFL